MQSSNNLVQAAKIIRKLQQPDSLKDVIIKLDKKEKDGETFSLEVNGEGEVTFNTVNNVSTKRNKEISNMSEQQLKELINKFMDAYFFSFKDNYITDSESKGNHSMISIKAGDLSKQVTYNKNSKLPQQIRKLEQAIINTTGATKWIGG
jgi:nucleotidyltransferase/DNA polymerase involved in DNA repair